MEGMVRDEIQKSWEAVKNTVWKIASFCSGKPDRAGEHSNTGSVILPCTENWKYPRRHFATMRKGTQISGTQIVAFDHNHNAHRE